MVFGMAWYCCHTAGMARSRYATRNLDQRHKMTHATVPLLSLACIITAHHHIGKTSAMAETAAFHREAKSRALLQSISNKGSTTVNVVSGPIILALMHCIIIYLPGRLALMYSTPPIVPAETCIRALQNHLSFPGETRIHALHNHPSSPQKLAFVHCRTIHVSRQKVAFVHCITIHHSQEKLAFMHLHTIHLSREKLAKMVPTCSSASTISLHLAISSSVV